MTESLLTIYLSLTSSPSTPRTEITIPKETTNAADLRRKASAATSVPLDKLKLIFRGRVIAEKSEGNVVEEMKLEDGCVVHVMGKPVTASASSAAASGGGVTATGVANVESAMPAGASLSTPSSAAMTGMSLSSNNDSPLNAALTKLRSSNDGATYRTALTTADKLLGNIVSHPMEEKYRNIKKSNPAFSKRLGAVPGGSDLLLASGFTIEMKEGGVEYFVLVPSADKWPQLVASREEVKKVLGEATSSSAGAGGVGGMGAANNANMNAGAAAGAMPPGGMPNLFSSGMPPTGGPDMSMMQSMMNDPNMMQNALSMINNPMVQNMMRNDPRMANNPMLQQSLDALQRNPEMLNQVSQMMSDPNMRNRMASMMGGAGGMGGAGAGTGAADPFAGGPDAMRRQMEQFQQMSQQFGGNSGGFGAGGSGTAPASGTGGSGTSSGGGGAANGAGSGSGGGGNDSEMTEEEMIAEAIARSLRES